MPKRPTLAQRVTWHRAHQRHCACRPPPAALRPLIERGQSDVQNEQHARAIAHFFEDRPAARRLFAVVQRAVAAAGASTLRVSKSQISWSRKRAFAWAWTPDRWLKGKTAPLVLSIALGERDRSARWKEVLEPRPGRFMHHLELRSSREVDRQVRAWLAQAWRAA